MRFFDGIAVSVPNSSFGVGPEGGRGRSGDFLCIRSGAAFSGDAGGFDDGDGLATRT
jgi:hypothetical protein